MFRFYTLIIVLSIHVTYGKSGDTLASCEPSFLSPKFQKDFIQLVEENLRAKLGKSKNFEFLVDRKLTHLEVRIKSLRGQRKNI